MATSSLVSANLAAAVSGAVKLSTAEGTVNVYCTADGRVSVGFPVGIADGLVWARNSISLAPGATGTDIQLDAIVDADSGLTIPFKYILGIFIFNTTQDPTAYLAAQKGAAQDWDVPWAGWQVKAYGYDASGRMLPGMIWNPNHDATYGWVVTNTTDDSIKIVASTPLTATTVTGQLIVIGTLT